MTLAAITGLAIAISPAFAQTDQGRLSPEIAAQPAKASSSDVQAQTAGQSTPPVSEDASADNSWNSLDDTTRFLSIMGTADGFSAAGAGTPCFPGKDNNKLDLELKSAGFSSKSTTDLAPALALLSSPTEQCSKTPKRGYTSELLKTMPDDHLAIYLTGAVRGYAHVKSCAAENHSYAAAAIAAEIFAASIGQQPHEIISSALKDGCAPPAA